MESKWSDRMSQYTDGRKTPDLDHINTEEYNTLSKLILLLIHYLISI